MLPLAHSLGWWGWTLGTAVREKLQERLWEQLLEKLLGKEMRRMHQEKVMMMREIWAWLQAQLLGKLQEKLMRVMLLGKVRAKLIQASREQGQQQQARQAVTALQAQLELVPE
jgi:hypothetical protein